MASSQDRAQPLPDQVDVLVVGGGITGAGVALEAARCGVSVLLLEAHDFAWGTSSRSSKMVHGGLRYLKSGALGLTQESVREREKLMRELPGLVIPLPFLMPIRRGQGPGPGLMGLALAFYDRMAGRRTRRWWDAEEVLAAVPGLRAEGLRGAWSYEDAAVDDARLVLRTLQEARSLGVQAVNHTPVEAFLSDASGRVVGARARGQDIRATVVVNATGVWADGLRSIARLQPAARPLLRPLRGSHLVLPHWRLPLQQAIAFNHPRDGRHVFMNPWWGAVQVGTTDLDHRAAIDREPGITAEEFDYLMEALTHAFPASGLSASDVVATWSGVRPVVAGGAADPSKEAREAWVADESGLITVTGGKLTTFLSMAREALALGADRLPALAEAQALAEAEPHFHTRMSVRAAARLKALEAQHPGIGATLAGRWGASLDALLEETPEQEHTVIPGSQTLWAELRWSLRCESASGLDDLLLRRTRLGFVQAEGASVHLPRIKPMACAELGLSDEAWAQWTGRYRAIIDQGYGPRAA